MQSLNVLLTFLPLLLTAKQKFPIRGTIVFICPTLGLTLKTCLLWNVQQIPSHCSMISMYMTWVVSLIGMLLLCPAWRQNSVLTGCRRAIALQSHSDINWNVLGEKIKVLTIGVVFGIKSPGVIVLPTGTRLSITGNLSPITAMIPRNYGGSYTKSYIDPTALLYPLVNPQSHWLIVLLHFSQIKSWKSVRVSPHLSPVTWYIPPLTRLNEQSLLKSIKMKLVKYSANHPPNHACWTHCPHSLLRNVLTSHYHL